MKNYEQRRESMVAFLCQMANKSLNRIMSNSFNPEREEKQLHRFLESAYEVSSPQAIAEIYATFSIFYYAIGRFKKSIEAGEKAAAEVLQSPDLSVKAFLFRPLSKNAETYHDLGDTLSALELTSTLLNTPEYADFRPPLNEMHSLIVNMGFYHLALEEYEAAEDAFRRVLQLPENVGQEYANAIADAYRGLSEIYLLKGDFVNAWTNGRLAYEIAQRQRDPLAWFYANCAMAHIAEQDPNCKAAPESYYATTIKTIEQMGTPVLRAVALLHEARFHHRTKNLGRAKQFAALAANILHDAKITAFDPELHHLITAQ
ncbi:MAG: hypothetical protein CUN55_09335 [Phototrophicales bacterium]|nr:MAG: hypothetical protein CUN55_09335 [Phototrophicales bacterium]